MREFMLLIRNESNNFDWLSTEQQQEFLQKCKDYIGELKKEGKLIAAQPLVREGKIISGSTGAWMESTLNNTGVVQVGYYHILADNMDEAVAIAKNNPEFEYGTTASIEVRPVKMKEESTGFVYPKNE
ncbi:MAG TPA: YciI family protein [Chitinophagaceae bacterium]